ncbi:hypothetical protein HV310_16115 [Citrobacter freundii]|nr:hypothetical protein [Citrobacter freundii]QMR46155.1 hypothetical protein HV310_16115 [Citrobacter freundii]
MLRIPESDWQVVDEQPQISVPYLRKVTPQAKRFTQWMQRTHSRLLGAPENVLSYCSSELISGQFPDRNGWFYAGDALALLTYSVHSSDNVPLIEAIEQHTGLKLPVPAFESKLEGQFGKQLRDALDYLGKHSPYTTYYEIEKQKRIGNYRVDFFVTQKFDAPDGSTNKRHSIVEFDEAAHKLPRYRKADKQRDYWFRKYHPEIKVIRVRHEEEDTWLEAIRRLQRLIRLEDGYVHCLQKASIVRAGPEMRINSISVRNAYDTNQNEWSFLLKRPAQPLREMGNLLLRLGIPYEKGRDVRFPRKYLRAYGI